MFYETMEELLPSLKVVITDGQTETIYPLESFSSVSGFSSSNTTESKETETQESEEQVTE